MSKEEKREIPEDGTLEWAKYVSENYSTEYFAPVDLVRAGRILEKARWEEAVKEFVNKK